ncbi:MAG: hypothetical protein ABSB71_07770 [Candidatus Bathyarchaeia archaeon]
MTSQQSFFDELPFQLKRLRIEFPHLKAVLTHAPCENCIENVNCEAKTCPKLYAWLLTVGGM